VGEIDQVVFVNDSKATNAHAAAASLASFDSVVWIVGGLLKGIDPRPLVVEFAKKLRGAVVIGKDTALLESLFSELVPELPIRVISGEGIMEQAVATAASLAQAGDTVLLAPAAASMDQFRDYSDRGNQFIKAVLGRSKS
jgi:UDP-N-acetylmuramoylalanine--D-glutamate ligase